MRGNMNKHARSILKYCLCVYFILTVSIICCTQKSDFEKGIEALKKGDYLKAVQSLNDTLQSDTLNANIHYHLSLAYAHLDSMSKSMKHYMKIVELESSFKDSIELKELLALFLKLEPYPSVKVPMKRMNMFKGAFSPGGDTIVVAAAKRDVANIYLIRLDGTVIKKITSKGMNTDPLFSPTGRHIVFVSDQDGDDELYLYDVGTEQTTQLTNNTAQDFSPSFSPNGEEIVYVSNMDDEFKWELYKISVKNKHIQNLTRNNYWDGFPKYTSDGKSIVFSSKHESSENIYTIKTGGGGEKILYESDADDNDPQLIANDLYFKSNRDGNWEVYRFNIKTKKLTQLTHNTIPDWNPRVSINGTKIIMARQIKQRWQLYYIDYHNAISSDVLVKKMAEYIDTVDKKEP
jgi:Tol biopolymer transport system component